MTLAELLDIPAAIIETLLNLTLSIGAFDAPNLLITHEGSRKLCDLRLRARMHYGEMAVHVRIDPHLQTCAKPQFHVEPPSSITHNGGVGLEDNPMPDMALKLEGTGATFEDLLNDYLAEKRLEQQNPRHLHDTEKRIREMLDMHGWEIPASATREGVVAYLASLTGRDGGEPSASFFNNVRGYLVGFFDWIERQGHGKSPATNIRFRSTKDREALRGMERYELECIETWCRTVRKKNGLEAADFYHILFHLGFRVSECSGLRRSNFIDEGPEGSKLVVRSAKSKKIDELPVWRTSVYDALRRRAAGKQHHDRLFTVNFRWKNLYRDACQTIEYYTRRGWTNDRGQPIKPFAWEDANGDTLCPHSMRRGLALVLEEENVPMKTRQLMLRHSDIKTTMNIYTNPAQVAQQNHMRQLGSALEAGGEKKYRNSLDGGGASDDDVGSNTRSAMGAATLQPTALVSENEGHRFDSCRPHSRSEGHETAGNRPQGCYSPDLPGPFDQDHYRTPCPPHSEILPAPPTNPDRSAGRSITQPRLIREMRDIVDAHDSGLDNEVDARLNTLRVLLSRFTHQQGSNTP